MKPQELLSLYQNDAFVQILIEKLKTDTNIPKIHLKGLVGSLDTFFVAANFLQNNTQNQLIILHDKEEASYVHFDLQNILPEKEILFFPTSYKRPYEYTEIENANVLMRAEVLNKVSQNVNKIKEGEIIITYPEALSEKVINKKSLLEHTYTAKKGENLDTNFLADLLVKYEFERTDFVYEAGQFAARGGIFDVFSFANDLPYRIELFGNEIESIRTFDPETQLSVNEVTKIAIVPNTQTKFLLETRESLLEFLPVNTHIWAKNLTQTLEILTKCFDKVEKTFKENTENTDIQIISDPELLFETKKSFLKHLEKYPLIEFGKTFYTKKAEILEYPSAPQPSFNKDFNLLVKDLMQKQNERYTCLIASDSFKQLERLQTIFEEINPNLKVKTFLASLREGFIDKNLQIVCYTDHQIFERFYRYKVKQRYSKSRAITLKELRTMQPGDYVTHIDYGIGRFAGLEKMEINGKMQETIRLVYKDNDLLYVNIQALHKVSKHTGKEGENVSISKLGSPEWDNKKAKVKKNIKDIAKELILLYAKRRVASGFAFAEDDFLQAELESSFIYEDTPDQAKATADVKADMEKPNPMDRLVCGDVGFGKTEIAIRAAFKAVCNGKQAAILVPTTILAMQHFRTFSERLEKLPCTVEYINRFKTAKQIKTTLERVADGKVDILIGTHSILNKKIVFKNLGLLVIDEEQKFGVKSKERIKEMRFNVDCLTLTATPIPRTLHFSLMGARDLSIIATPPPNRQPVTTEIQTFKEDFIRDAISHELRRGGQVFFVHNRVKDIEAIGNIILRLVPDARIGVAHGQMEGGKLEKIMAKFIDNEFDVLISTNIIESGLDIPNANTIIINHAHMHGLSDLHQMRGRVGRSNKKAFCYLLVPSMASLTQESRKRLQTLEEFSDLGDGFKVAMRDLDIRGAGNLLGSEQSGFINDLGFETYHKILDEAIQELKETEFRELFSTEISTKKLVRDCVIETDLQLLIPDDYVKSISERLSLYNQLDNIKTEEDLVKFSVEIQDRFGNIPVEVLDLVEVVRLRWFAVQIGFEKLSIKNAVMRGFFTTTNQKEYFQSDMFGKVIVFVQNHAKTVRLREVNKKQMLIFDEITTISKGITSLKGILG